MKGSTNIGHTLYWSLLCGQGLLCLFVPSPAPAPSIFEVVALTKVTLWPIIQRWPLAAAPPSLSHPAIVVPLALWLLLPAVLLATAIRRKATIAHARYVLTGFSYYLALALLHYGFSKAFKWQFYLPEPNTLYTPFGELPPDLAYWSLLGLQRPYVVGAGLLELLAAALLLWRRTRYLGAMLATLILAHVWALNLTFDLQVGAYSAWLLSLALTISLPAWRTTLMHLLGKAIAPLPSLTIPALPPARWIGLKTLLVGFMLVDSLYLYLDTGRFNDDAAPRPPLHGAYALAAPPTDPAWDSTALRFFVHRHGYGITQSPHGWTTRTLLYRDSQHIQLVVPPDTFTYRHTTHGDTLLLYPQHHATPIQLLALPWRDLPAWQ